MMMTKLTFFFFLRKRERERERGQRRGRARAAAPALPDDIFQKNIHFTQNVSLKRPNTRQSCLYKHRFTKHPLIRIIIGYTLDIWKVYDTPNHPHRKKRFEMDFISTKYIIL